MTEVAIRLAVSDTDFEVARSLGFEWAETHLSEFPEHREIITKVFEPVAYAKTMADLHIIHARPKGAVFLAFLDNKPVGCVMYQEMEPGVAEIKRLFVQAQGRGHKLGKRLLEAMFAQMRVDGYETVRFSSARILTHARNLYESVGFKDIPHPENFPKEMHHFVYFMEQPL